MAWKKMITSGGALGTPSGGTLTNCTFPTANINTDEAVADNAVTLAKMAGLDRGHIIYGDSSGNPASLANSTTDGHVLTVTNSDGDFGWEAAGSAATRNSLGIDTDDSPQFAGLNVGSAADTTLTGSSGVLSVEGKAVYVAGGSDVALIDGGTGSGTASGARTNLGLAIGSDVQAYDAQLATLAGVSGTNASAVGNLTGTNSGDQTTVSGNSGTTTLAVASTAVVLVDNEATDELNAVPFGAGAAYTGSVGLETDGDLHYRPSTGCLTATQLAGTLQTASQGNITTVGTIGTGVWQGTTVAVDQGGTGVTSMGALKNALDDETWTFANAVSVPALTVTGNLDVTGTTTTIDSANLAITDAVIQLSVLADQTDYAGVDSAIIFGHSTNADGGKIINDAGTGFKFTALTANDDPKDGTIIGEGTAGAGSYVDIYSKGMVLSTQTTGIGAPTEVEGMLLWDGSDLYIGNPS